MLHDRIIRWSLPASVGETAVNLTSGYELVRSSCVEIESGGMWTDANHRRSIKFSPELRWNGEKTGGTLTSNRAKTKELVAIVGADDSPPELWTPDLRIESTCATFAPSFGRPFRAPGRFAWLWPADTWRLSRNTFIHQSSRTDGRTDSQPDIMLEVESTIYRLIKRFPCFFFFNFVMLLKWQ